MRRAETDSDARHAADRLDDTDELRRTKRAAEDLKTWREVRDPDSVAFVVDQFGDHDSRVAHVVRAGFNLTFEDDVSEALVLGAGKQTAEHRVAVIARKAPPHDPRRRFKQCRRTAISDDRKIEPVVGHSRACPLDASKSSALRTCAGLLKTPVRPGK